MCLKFEISVGKKNRLVPWVVVDNAGVSAHAPESRGEKE